MAKTLTYRLKMQLDEDGVDPDDTEEWDSGEIEFVPEDEEAVMLVSSGRLWVDGTASAIPLSDLDQIEWVMLRAITGPINLVVEQIALPAVTTMTVKLGRLKQGDAFPLRIWPEDGVTFQNTTLKVCAADVSGPYEVRYWAYGPKA